MLAVGVVVGVLFIAGSIFFIMIYIRYVLLSSWRAGLRCSTARVQIAVATLSGNSKLFTPILPLFTNQRNW